MSFSCHRISPEKSRRVEGRAIGRHFGVFRYHTDHCDCIGAFVAGAFWHQATYAARLQSAAPSRPTLETRKLEPAVRDEIRPRVGHESGLRIGCR